MDDGYVERVQVIHRRLGIPVDYAQRTGLTLQREPEDLVEVAPGRSQRRHWLEPEAAAHWARLEVAAERDGIQLRIVSAWRSLEYQTQLIERKLERGQHIAHVLRINAAPGYSEHHTGRAVDLGVPGGETLTEAFEHTDAFGWLCTHAHQWGFTLSYPRDNANGIVYEPWHWAYTPAA
jgi:D-alanyl-D-alanine carboxypeptidase